jgi:hypothetical protein
MCNQSAAELIARLKRAYPAYTPSEGDCASNGIPKAGARFKHRHRGHMVTVITLLRKTFPTGKPAGLLAGWGYVSFYGYTMRFRYEQSGV